jgi:hypothetical protein
MGHLELVRVPALRTAGPEAVDFCLNGRHAGTIALRVCDQCEVATVEDIRMEQAGLADCALRLLVGRLPNHRWTTSRATAAQAEEFWSSLPWWQRSVGDVAQCSHMRRIDQTVPAPRHAESSLRQHRHQTSH